MLDSGDQGPGQKRGGTEGGDGKDAVGNPVELGTGLFGGDGVVQVGEAMEVLQVIAEVIAAGQLGNEGFLEGFDVLFGFEVVAAAFVERFADGPDLERLGAAETLDGGGEAVDVQALDDVARAEVVFQLVEQGAEVLGALGAVASGDDDLIGEQAVLEGVAAGAAFALGGAGAGGFLGVGAVGT